MRAKTANKQSRKDSYIEVRLVATLVLVALFLGLILPAMLASDWTGDNLPDAWKQQYGLSTNVYAPTNLVAWWQLNGTNNTDPATDRSGNGINGTLTNFPAVAYGTGLFSNALYFNTNGAVKFPTTNSALVATTNQFTFSAWFQATNATATAATIATWKDTQTNTWTVGAGTNGAASASFLNAIGYVQKVSPTNNIISLYDGNWHQVAATYGTNKVATVYVDGQTQASGPITNWVAHAPSAFTFGATNSVNKPFALDEARLYNRALATNEILQLPFTYSDLNSNGLSVYEDYLEGLSPTSTTGIVTAGFANSGLTAFYGNSNPTLTITGGNGQLISASAFATNALVVLVKNSGGTALINAPITFSIPTGSDGGLALTSGGTTTTSLSLTTNSTGYATIYYQAGSDVLLNNSIVATAVSNVGSVSVTFTEYCGVRNGLALWLETTAGVTSSGGSVSSWADQTGNFTVTASSSPPSFATNQINGLSTVRFNGSQWLYNSSTLTPGANQDMTVFVVGQTTSPSAHENVFCLGNGTTKQGRHMGYISSDQYFDTSFSAVTGIAAPSANTFVSEEVMFDSTASLATFYRNGTQTATATETASGLTAGITIGCDFAFSYGWQGDIAEIIIYNRKLSSSELAQVDGRIANKYGLYSPNATWPSTYTTAVQAEITRNQWNKNQADAYVAFLATNPAVPPTGLNLWMRADVGVQTSGTNVTQWTDQSYNQFLASQSSSTSQPLFVSNVSNGQSALQFSGGQTLVGTGNLNISSTSGATILAVQSTTAPGNQCYSITAGGVSSTGLTRNMGYLYSQQTFSTTNQDPRVGSAPNSGTFVVDGGTLDTTGANVTFYRNGIQTGTGTVSGTGSVPAGFCVGSYVGGNFAWQGDIAEVLVYNRVLSTTELNQASVYLANKYGLYNPNATWPSSYTTAVQSEITLHQWNKAQADAYVAFQAANPTMLTNGLQLWFKGDSLPTNTTTVSSWSDSSPSGNTLTQSGAAMPTYEPADINGLGAVRFYGSQSLFNPTNIGLNADMTMLVVSNTSTPAAPQVALNFGNGPTHNVNRGIGNISDCQLFTGFSNDYLGAAVPNANIFSVQAVSLNSSLNGVNFYLNGVPSGSASVSGLQPIASGICVGAVPGWNVNWTGDIAEVLVYDHQLSSAELQQVGVYLANKYGLYNPNATWPSSYSTAVQAEIASYHWSKAQADAYVAFQAANPTMLTNGLQLWFKADSLPTSTTTVSSWADSSANGNSVTSSGAAMPTYQPSDINGLPAVRFSGAQSLYNPANIGFNADMTMLVVSNTSTPGVPQVALNFGNGPTHNVNRGIGNMNSVQLFTGFSNDYAGGPIPSANTFSVQAVSLNSSLNGANFYLNGAANGSASVSGLQPVASGICVGAVPGWNVDWTGDIAEVLVYDHQLSSTELQQVSTYLANKYGLYSANATWYNSSPYLAIKPEIIQHQWNEAQANQYLNLQTNTSGVVTNGLMLWATADNVSYANGTMTVVDQTGNYPLTQVTSANQPAVVSNDLNGHAGLHFTGSQWLSNSNNGFPTGMGADMSIVTVASNTSSDAGSYYSLYLGQNAAVGQNRALGCSTYNEYFDTNGLSCTGNGAQASFTAEIATLDASSNVVFYQNGAQSSTSALSGLQGVSVGVTLGAAGNSTGGWQGDINEILVYDHKLSAAEIQQLSIYLAAKYQLPYSGAAAPTISPAGGSYTTSVNVSLAGSVPSSVIKYTLDGTEPTNNSPTYTGTITLTGSALVQAALFVNNELSGSVASTQFYVNDSGQTGAPVTPTNLTVSSPSSVQANVSWQLTGTVNYSAIDVYRSSDGGATWTLVASLDPTATSYADTNVQSGTSYQYYVGTVNASGQSNTASSSSVSPATLTSVGITITSPSGVTTLP